jgi:hypothetical protein
MAEKTKRNPQGAGAPSVLSKELQDEFLNNRSLGLSFERSAKLCGISVTSVKNWRAIGEAAFSKPVGKRSAHEQKCVTFVTALSRVDDEWLRRCEVVLNFAMTPGQNATTWANASIEERRLAVETARWKAQHQAPGDYSTRTEITGAEGGPVDVDVTGMDVFDIMLKARTVDQRNG